jgi:hypothetical protein
VITAKLNIDSTDNSTYGGRSNQEIAKDLCITEGVVRGIYSRAMAELRDYLTRHWRPPDPGWERRDQ